MIRKYIKIIPVALLLVVFFGSCNSNKKEILQEARNRGMKAAQALVITDHDNIIKLESAILEAKACQSEYLLMGDTLAAREFDNAFREYVKVHDEILAKELFE